MGSLVSTESTKENKMLIKLFNAALMLTYEGKETVTSQELTEFLCLKGERVNEEIVCSTLLKFSNSKECNCIIPPFRREKIEEKYVSSFEADTEIIDDNTEIEQTRDYAARTSLQYQYYVNSSERGCPGGWRIDE